MLCKAEILIKACSFCTSYLLVTLLNDNHQIYAQWIQRSHENEKVPVAGRLVRGERGCHQLRRLKHCLHCFWRMWMYTDQKMRTEVEQCIGWGGLIR
jgi:hypothetical protein